MTVAVKPRRIDYAEDGVTVAFPVPWRFNDPADVKALRTAADGSETVLTYGSSYSVTGGSTDVGGELTLTVAGASGGALSIWSETARGQTADYDASGTFPAETHEARLDNLAMVDQEQDDELERTPKFPRASVPVDFGDLGDMVEGDLLQYRSGKLRRADFLGSAGKFAAFSALGLLVGVVGSLPASVPALAQNIATDDGSNVENKVGRLPFSVLEIIDPSLHGAIAAGSVTADLQADFDTAALVALALDRPLWAPAGTYTMEQWFPPAGIKVVTDGWATVFKQLNTGGTPKRFFEVQEDGVQLWPGSSASFDGSMTPGGTNATAFNSAVRVHAPAGGAIKTFTMGDIYAKDMGGDAFETGADATGTLGHCQVGTIYLDNVYRNGVSITAGTSGYIGAIVQIGGVGLLAFDAEPDPSCGSAPKQWHIEFLRGNRASIVGDPAVPMGVFTFGSWEIDYALGASNPVFDISGVSEATSPTLFQVGFRYRNAMSIVGRSLIIRNHARAAIEDIGTGVADVVCELLKADFYETHQCGATGGFEAYQQKTRRMEFGTVVLTDKVTASTPCFNGGQLADSWLKIGGGKITGRICNAHSGSIAINDTAIAGSADSIIRNVGGDIRLIGVTCIGAAIIFENPVKMPLAIGSTLGATTIVSGGSANAQYFGCTIGGVAVPLGWFNAAAALQDAANDAAAAALPTPVPLGGAYRNGPVQMVRVA